MKRDLASVLIPTLLTVLLPSLCFAVSAEELIQAAHDGKLSEVKNLVAKGADVNGRSIGGATPLWGACRNGHIEVVKFLLDKGANINAGSDKGTTPLMNAAMFDHADLVEFLLDKGADRNAKAKNGVTALMVAQAKGHNLIVEILQTYKPSSTAKGESKPQAEPSAPRPPARPADSERSKGVADLFREPRGYFAVPCPVGWKVELSKTSKGEPRVGFEAPQKPWARIAVLAGPYGKTTDALYSDAQDKARRLKAMFPDGSFEVRKESLGDQVLVVFSNAMPGKVFQELVEFQSKGIVYTVDLSSETQAGIDTHRGTFKKFLNSFVPLDSGRRYSDQEIRAQIAANTGRPADAPPPVAQPAQPDGPKLAESTNASAESSPLKNRALLAAAAKGDLKAVKRFLAEGAEVNTRDHKFTCTPLILAFQAGNVDVVKTLLAAGADLHAKTDAGHTAFDLTKNGPAQIGHVEICRMLAETEADAEVKKRYLTLALLRATAFPEVGLAIVKDLLAKGAGPNAMTDGNVKTALMLAASTGQADVVKELVKNGADVNAYLPHHLAAVSGDISGA